MEPPPGGPPDDAAPQLVADSARLLRDASRLRRRRGVPVRRSDLRRRVAQPGSGHRRSREARHRVAHTRFPKVRWRRNRIAVRPEEGWQPDRVYRVELLPGVTDLQRNRSERGAVLTFSTGAARPGNDVRRHRGGLDFGSALAAGAGRRDLAARQPALPRAGRLLGTLQPGSASGRRVHPERGPGRESQPPGRPARSVRHRAGERPARHRARAVGVRPRHRPPRIRSVTPLDSVSATRRVHPVARPEAASPARRRARVAAAGFDAGSSRVAAGSCHG